MAIYLIQMEGFYMFGRKKYAALLGGFLGTGALTIVVLAVSHSSIGLPYFVALAAGIALTMLVFTFSASTYAAHLNPALTLGLWTIRKIKSVDAVLYIVAQMLGAYLAYMLFTYFVSASLSNTAVAFSGRILVAEAVGTFALAFGWAAAYYRGYKGLAFGSAVGLAYLVGILLASSASAGLLNPALALGSRQWAWGTYVLGPVLGSLVGFNLYSLVFADPEKVVAKSSQATAASVVARTAKAIAPKAKAVAKKKPVTRAKK